MRRNKNIVTKVGERLLRHGPADNWRLLRRKLSSANGAANTIAPALMADTAAVVEYLRWKTSSLSPRVVLVGRGREAELLSQALAQAGKGHDLLSDWPPGDDALGAVGRDADVVVCPWPGSPDDWRQVARMRARLPNRVLTFQELVLPLGLVDEGRRRSEYRFHDLGEILGHYTGAREMGPMDALNRAYPIAGKRVIEFGPMDGHQTAALVNLGAAAVTCVEARAENALKTLAAKAALGWRNVEVVVDDFHNAGRANYGTFDLAFAHGVYYHSFAPFVFFENLFSLADHVFFGGYIATDDFPDSDFLYLEHRGQRYAAKVHGDGHGMDQGINPTGYYFRADDLLRLFRNHGFEIVPLPNEEQTPGQPPGRYLRFLAVKKAGRA
ncbi:MAG: class I SAM-dependent methyltransferase [Dehalococcoidia bacterium]